MAETVPMAMLVRGGQSMVVTGRTPASVVVKVGCAHLEPDGTLRIRLEMLPVDGELAVHLNPSPPETAA